MNTLELFSGAGGLALGLKNSGFTCSALLERDKYACRTLRENFTSQIFETDISDFEFDFLEEEVMLVAGGPPCQPFSIGGKAKGHTDARDMFPEAVRAIRELRPKSFIFENVKGLTRPSFASYFEYIVLRLSYPSVVPKLKESWVDHLSRLERVKSAGKQKKIEYNVLFQCLNAADYGAPQKRERVFFVGFRNDLGIRWAFPKKTHSKESLDYAKFVTGRYWDETGASPSSEEQRLILDGSLQKKLENSFGFFPPEKLPWVTVRQALGDLPTPQLNGHTLFSGHELRLGAKSYPGHTGSPLDQPSKALKAGDHGVPGGENMLRFHDESVRYFTIREAARIQTFPDSFSFSGTWSEGMRQLGNAVPVKLSEAVAGSVKQSLVEGASA